MLTACNHMQVRVRYDRSPPELAPDCLDSLSYSTNGGINESSYRNIQARYYTYYDIHRKAYRLTINLLLYFRITVCDYHRDKILVFVIDSYCYLLSNMYLTKG